LTRPRFAHPTTAYDRHRRHSTVPPRCPASGPLRCPDSPWRTPAASGALQPHLFAPQKPPQGTGGYALRGLDPVFAPPTPPPPASGRLRRLPKRLRRFFISVSRRRGGLP